MKPISGHGEPVKKGVLTAEEALRYAMSLPVTTTITGMESLDILHQNLAVAQGLPAHVAAGNAGAARSREDRRPRTVASSSTRCP